MTTEFDRRGLLRAGGLLGLGAVLAACSGQESGASPAPSSSSSSAAPAPQTTTPAPSAVDLLAGDAGCVLTPETIAGPTWFDAHVVRSDIRDGRPGVPLDLAFRVVRLPGCAPVAQAVVDLWQCDALGVYSGFAGAGPGEGGSPDGRDGYGDPQSTATDSEVFLRGTQVTAADGIVRFSTVYPGWYPTRAPHLHLEVHLDRRTVLTTQVFFDDAVSDTVYGSEPYRRHPGRDTRNDRDAFYSDGARLRLAPAPGGWLGALTLGVPAVQ